MYPDKKDDGKNMTELKKYIIQTKTIEYKIGEAEAELVFSIYAKSGLVIENETPFVVYVMGTLQKRVGTASNEEIISSLLSDGYVVGCLDLMQNERAKCPELDWAIQPVLSDIFKGKHFDKEGILKDKKFKIYLPAK